MATIISRRIIKEYVKSGSGFIENLFSSHIEAVEGLLDGNGKIDSFILPTADDATLGAVRLSDDYKTSSGSLEVALLQDAGKRLYDELISKIQNLESPIDFMGSTFKVWDGLVAQETINDELNTYVENINGIGSLRPGLALIVHNGATWEYVNNGHYEKVTGNWLWIFNGVDWQPAIDFPEAPMSSDVGTSETAMIEGLISKAMLWKLKNIKSEATKNLPEATTTNIKMNGTQSLGTSPNFARGDHVHPVDTSRVPATRTVNGKTLSSNILLYAGDIKMNSDTQMTVYGELSNKAPIESPGFTGVPLVGGEPIASKNDSRFTDKREPVAHAVNASTYGYGDNSNAGHLRVGNNIAVAGGTISVSEASESIKGVVEFADLSEALMGNDKQKAVSPAKARAIVDKFGSIKIYPTIEDASDDVNLIEGKVFLVVGSTIV